MEAGILVAVVLVLLALALCRGRWTLLREPGRPMSAPEGRVEAAGPS